MWCVQTAISCGVWDRLDKGNPTWLNLCKNSFLSTNCGLPPLKYPKAMTLKNANNWRMIRNAFRAVPKLHRGSSYSSCIPADQGQQPFVWQVRFSLRPEALQDCFKWVDWDTFRAAATLVPEHTNVEEYAAATSAATSREPLHHEDMRKHGWWSLVMRLCSGQWTSAVL